MEIWENFSEIFSQNVLPWSICLKIIHEKSPTEEFSNWCSKLRALIGWKILRLDLIGRERHEAIIILKARLNKRSLSLRFVVKIYLLNQKHFGSTIWRRQFEVKEPQCDCFRYLVCMKCNTYFTLDVFRGHFFDKNPVFLLSQSRNIFFIFEIRKFSRQKRLVAVSFARNRFKLVHLNKTFSVMRQLI